MSSPDELRSRLAQFYACTKVDTGLGAELHSVTFQPLHSRPNQDRVVMQRMYVHDQEWLFLAVCDGHGGASTARYTASHLPNRISSMLAHLVQHDLQGKLDRENVSEKAQFIASELARCIQDFDGELGQVVQTICPDPTALSERQARAIVQEYPDALKRACGGTTLAAALVNMTHRFMWAMGVGDSTVALSTVDAEGKRIAHELCPRHSLTDPQECNRIMRNHPRETDVVENGRLVGVLPMSRAIGDFSLKLPVTYSSRFFCFLSDLGYRPLRPSTMERIRTPPYLIAEPSIRFVDLEAVWSDKPILMIYSDGVDNLLNNVNYINPWRPKDIIASRAIAVLLQNEVDDTVSELLGYPVDLRWSGKLRNKAVDVLGNLIGGTNPRILQAIMDQSLLADRSTKPSLYVDDTSIILCYLADPPGDALVSAIPRTLQ